MSTLEISQNMYWIRVDHVYQAGRENLALKPKAMTEAFLVVPDQKFQHAIQICDWNTITPEALWIGTYNQALRVIAEYQKHIEISCTILPIPTCLSVEKCGKIQLNYIEGNDFMSELITQQPEPIAIAKKKRVIIDGKKINEKINLDSTLSDYLLGKETMKKVIESKNLKHLYIDIFYCRDINDPPLMENVLDYKGVFARFSPILPQGWRYMCKLTTYAEQLHSRMKNIAEKSWGITWSEKVLDDMLSDGYLFTEITIEVLNNIIFESELLGNELDITEEITFDNIS